jgi:hypothetical protein
LPTLTDVQFRTAIKTRMRINAPTPEWGDAEIDAAGTAALNAAFPALYQKTRQAGLTVVLNSTTRTGTVTVTDATRVYKLVDADWDEVIKGWWVKDGTTIAGIWDWTKTVDSYAYAPINYGASMTFPDEWQDAIYTYAELNLIEVIMDDKSTKLILPYTADENALGAMQANLYNKWERERDAHAMALPVAVV